VEGTNRIVEVGDVKLEIEPTTVVLVGCKAATVADLKVGTQIKAAYWGGGRAGLLTPAGLLRAHGNRSQTSA
jgi:hypothetical protein